MHTRKCTHNVSCVPMPGDVVLCESHRKQLILNSYILSDLHFVPWLGMRSDGECVVHLRPPENN